MADNNGVKSRRDQQLERMRKKYPDSKTLTATRIEKKLCPTCFLLTREVPNF